MNNAQNSTVKFSSNQFSRDLSSIARGLDLVLCSDSDFLTWKSKVLERHMNDIFFTSCKKLFNVMKIRIGAIYGYEIMSVIQISMPEHPGNHKI